jgi:hypothetical protein
VLTDNAVGTDGAGLRYDRAGMYDCGRVYFHSAAACSEDGVLTRGTT